MTGDGATVTLRVLWDAPESPPPDMTGVYTWNGRHAGGGIASLLEYVEEHGVELRAQYLTWIGELGYCRVGAATLVDYLSLDEGLSYWWMTSFVEQNPWTPSQRSFASLQSIG